MILIALGNRDIFPGVDIGSVNLTINRKMHIKVIDILREKI